MRLAFSVAIVLIAFAANSVLNRAAVAGGEIDPVSFALFRVIFGAAALMALVAIRDRGRIPPLTGRLAGAACLALYVIGFSLAYLSLDSGVGALILFGGVQIVMFSGAVMAKDPMPPARWIGAAVALGGLVLLLWPSGGAAPSLLHGALMGLAAIGWGIYSLIGRRASDPLATTATSFVLAVPMVAALLALPDVIGGPAAMSGRGIALAAVSGVVTSGLGYALWYAVLPRLTSASAALLQLTVPVLAILGGVAFLGEGVGLRVVAASALVLGGVALGVLGAQRTASSKGS